MSRNIKEVENVEGLDCSFEILSTRGTEIRDMVNRELPKQTRIVSVIKALSLLLPDDNEFAYACVIAGKTIGAYGIVESLHN